MRKELEPYAHIEEELIALLNTLLAELPSNVASLEVMRAQPKSNGVIAKLKPRNPAAASVVLHAENGCGIIDFCFGWSMSQLGSYLTRAPILHRAKRSYSKKSNNVQGGDGRTSSRPEIVRRSRNYPCWRPKVLQLAISLFYVQHQP